MSHYNAVLARNTQNAAKSFGSCSQTVAFSHYNNLAAQLPIDPASGNMVAGGIQQQAEQCFKNIKAVLESIGHTMDDSVRISIFLQDIADLDAVTRVYASFFPAYVPALTIAAVAALPMNALLQVEALVSNGEGTIPGAPQAGDLVKIARNTSKAPLNSLSTQTVAFSHYNNISAQLPINPESGTIITGGIKAQTAQCLKNIKAILESIDVPFDDIVKINVYVKNLADMDAVNEVYTTFFPDSAIARAHAYFPARSVIAVTGLPMEALIQIEAVVSHGDGTPPQAVEDRHGIVIKASNTRLAPQDALASQTVAFSHYNHLSAQLPLLPESGAMVSGDVGKQAEQCLLNLKAIIESIGHTLADVVKINILLLELTDMEAVEAAYAGFFPAGLPARRVLGVAALPGEARIQIDAVLAHAEGTAPQR